MQATLNFRSRR